MTLQIKGGKTLAALGLVALAGCASKSEEIKPAYVSTVPYEHHSCEQIRREAQRISSHAARLAGEQDANRKSDAIMTGVAVVVFWPALFALKGDGATAKELARLRGEMNALEKVSARKNCGISFQKAQPTPQTHARTQSSRQNHGCN